MQLLFHLHLSNTKFAQKQLGKVTLREGKGAEPRGRYSPAVPKPAPASPAALEAPSLVLVCLSAFPSVKWK